MEAHRRYGTAGVFHVGIVRPSCACPVTCSIALCCYHFENTPSDRHGVLLFDDNGYFVYVCILFTPLRHHQCHYSMQLQSFHDHDFGPPTVFDTNNTPFSKHHKLHEKVCHHRCNKP